ncbi:MAG: beta-ketoacyl synthase N-terminal-like domain-containing protein, partial [Thermodesulfobacteriota bacterium]|nr:beta-ketoacyl synthase N-terminal-like domain-containing protein [Thermodesulfobacteriota bacterium]
MTKSRVAITGTGCVSALGMGQHNIWKNLREGIISCTPVPDWLFYTELSYPVFAAPPEPLSEAGRDFFGDTLPDFPTNAPSRTLNLAVSAVAEALNQAGIGLQYLRGKKVGIAMGTTVGCTFNNEEFYEQ